MAFADQATQARLQSDSSIHLHDAEAYLTRLRDQVHGRAPPNCAGALQDFVLGKLGYIDFALYNARRLIDELGRKSGGLAEDESFFTRFGAIRPDIADSYCPELRDALFQQRDNARVESRWLLEPCANEALNFALPANFASAIRRPQRAGLRLYSTRDAAVYAHPFQYQILSRDTTAAYESGSPRALSRLVTNAAEGRQLDRPIVVVQDRFAFYNFSHFLFDGVTRILAYLDLCGAADRPLFVMGSIPGEYQDLVLGTLAAQAGIGTDSFLFPDRPCLLTTSAQVHWFSDQVEMFGHPAQMAHPRSLAALGALSAAIPAPVGETRRVYISRGDATRRRVLNEPELIAALEKHGFVPVQLGKLPVAEQIGLFRGAEIVVGPHGMGMTHIAMSERLSRLVELFPRWGGTSAYAFIAQAGGIDYQLHGGAIARHSPADFTVEIERVLDLIGPDDAPRRRPSWRKAANLIPDSRNFGGFQVTPGGVDTVPPDSACDPPVWGLTPRVHVRSEHAVHPVVGGWDGITIIPGCTYTLSAWVMVPAAFAGTRVGLLIPGMDNAGNVDADVSRHGVWQRISVSATIPENVTRCAARLEIVGPAECWVASAGWQFERGGAATGLVVTG